MFLPTGVRCHVLKTSSMATPPRGRLQLPVVLLLSLGAALSLPTRTPSVSSRLAARCLVTLRFKARRRRLTPTLLGGAFPAKCARGV